MGKTRTTTSTPEDRWNVDDAVLGDLAQRDVTALLHAARDGDTAALNIVWSLFVKGVVFGRSGKVCKEIGHMGRRCSQAVCEEAFPSAVETGARLVLGTSHNLAKEPHRSLVFRDLDAKDAEIVSTSMNKPVLKYWDTSLGPDQDPWETWCKQVNHKLKNGFATEARRTWNQTRGLAVRIDQSNYLSKKSKVTKDDLFAAFAAVWAATLHPQPAATHSPSTDRHRLLVEAAEMLDFVGPNRPTLLWILRTLYNDACDNAYQDQSTNVPRVWRSIQMNLNGTANAARLTLDHVAVFCEIVEVCIELAYEHIQAEDPIINNHLRSARDVSRKFPPPDIATGLVENLTGTLALEYFDESDNTDEEV